MQRVPSSDGVDLAVHRLGGEPGEPPLLLVHANGFHGRVFGPLVARLSGRWHAVAPDLRGHGDSTLPGAGALIWDHFADDVLAVVDGAGLERPVAFGHSLGGAALLLAEHRRPGTFRSLYLYEPVVFPPELPDGLDLPDTTPDVEDSPMVQGALRRRDSFASYEEAYDNFASKPPLHTLDPEALRAYVTFGFAPAPDGSVRIKCLGTTEAQIYRSGRDHAAWDHLPEITCPVTIAFGHNQEFGPGVFAPMVGARLPHGRTEQFDHLGHFGPLEDPGAVAAGVARAFTAG